MFDHDKLYFHRESIEVNGITDVDVQAEPNLIAKTNGSVI